MFFKSLVPLLFLSVPCFAGNPADVGNPYLYEAPVAALPPPPSAYSQGTFRPPVAEEPEKTPTGDGQDAGAAAKEAKIEQALADCKGQWSRLVKTCLVTRASCEKIVNTTFDDSTSDRDSGARKDTVARECKRNCIMSKETAQERTNRCVEYKKLSGGRSIAHIENPAMEKMKTAGEECLGVEPAHKAKKDANIAKADKDLGKPEYGPDENNYFTVRGGREGDLRCANKAGQTSSISCINLRTGASRTIDEGYIRSYDDSYIPALEPVKAAAVKPAEPPCAATFSCGKDGDGADEIVGGSNGGGPSVEPDPPAPTPPKPEVEKQIVAQEPVAPKPAAPTPPAQKNTDPQKQQTAGAEGGSTGSSGGNPGGSSSGGSSGGANPFSPSPMNWASNKAPSSELTSSSNFNNGSSSGGSSSEVASGGGGGAHGNLAASAGVRHGVRPDGSTSGQDLASLSNSSYGGLSNASIGLGGSPSKNGRDRSAHSSVGGASASYLTPGAKFYKAPGSKPLSKLEQRKLAAAALKKKKKNQKEGLCRDNDIPCKLKLLAMSDKKFLKIKYKKNDRQLASYFSSNKSNNLPKEVGTGMHDAIRAGGDILIKNFILDDAGDLEYSPVGPSSN